MTTLQFVKSEIKKDQDSIANNYGTTVNELFFGNITDIFFNENTLEFVFDGYVIFNDDLENKESIGKKFTCSLKTPKGYISTKKINVDVSDNNNVTLEEATELLKFNTDAKKNTFDPFWHENEAKRKNNCAWNYIAQNYLSDTDKL